jgi:hypothetical protein
MFAVRVRGAMFDVRGCMFRTSSLGRERRTTNLELRTSNSEPRTRTWNLEPGPWNLDPDPRPSISSKSPARMAPSARIPSEITSSPARPSLLFLHDAPSSAEVKTPVAAAAKRSPAGVCTTARTTSARRSPASGRRRQLCPAGSQRYMPERVPARSVPARDTTIVCTGFCPPSDPAPTGRHLSPSSVEWNTSPVLVPR